MAKPGWRLKLLLIIILSVLIYIVLYIPFFPEPQTTLPQITHDYYEIVDELSGESLMMVPLLVTVGDELLTEDNRRFSVVKINGNTAYAKQIANTP